MNKISLKTRLIFVYFMLYSAFGCYYPFMTVYLKNRNLSFSQIGIVFAVQSLVSILSQPIWGFVTDKYLNKKLTLLINLLCCSLLIFLYIFSHSFITIVFSVGILILFQSTLMPISDSYCYELIEYNPELQYGKIRLVGSVSFALMSLAFGKIIEKTTIHSTYIAYSLFFLLTILFLWGIQYKGNSNISRPAIRDIFDILKDIRFVLFVFAVMAAGIATGVHSSYMPVLIEETGGDVAIIGIVWFAQAISELPMFFYGNKLMKKYGELNIFLFAVAMYIIRFFLSSISNHYTIVILIQLMQAVSYPIYLVSVMQYVNTVIPNKLKASGITIISSLGFGLGSFIGNLGGGIILENNSIYFLYRLITLMCIISFIIGFMLKISTSKKSKPLTS